MPDLRTLLRADVALVLDVAQAAAKVSRLIHETHDRSLVELDVRDGRNALVR